MKWLQTTNIVSLASLFFSCSSHLIDDDDDLNLEPKKKMSQTDETIKIQSIYSNAKAILSFTNEQTEQKAILMIIWEITFRMPQITKGLLKGNLEISLSV